VKAIVQTGYGAPDVLELRELDTPVPGEGEVLVRVRAAAIHAGDYFGVRGEPVVSRLFIGIPRPRKNHVVGLDVAGTVEAVGPGAFRFAPGEEVFGEPGRACAEYTCASEDRFVAKPPVVSFEHAAAVPVSALAALHGIRDAGRVHEDQKVLVNGASGGVGTFAVQIAKALGAEVTGVCSTGSVDLVRSLGADHVIDYTSEDFTAGGPRYDVILDNVANRPLRECRRALTDRGVHIPNSGHAGLSFVLKAAVLSMVLPKQGRPYVSTVKRADLEHLADLLAAGTIRSVIDRTYPLSQTADAFRHLGEGHARGKTVITLEGDRA
jgi:NADPH:quinone reductase-like Zn-dependent oxidoreductase